MCRNCSNNTYNSVFPPQNRAQLAADMSLSKPAVFLHVFFFLTKRENFSLSSFPNPMADVTNSTDYGSASLAAPSEPAGADSMDHIILSWLEVKQTVFSLCYPWFYSLALLSLLIKCLRTHKYIQALHTCTHTSLTQQLSSNERQKEFRLMHRGHVCTERWCFCDFYIWCVLLSAVLFYLGLLTNMPKPSEPRSKI